MWPFNRKPKETPERHEPLTAIVEQADVARNERSDTVAAFVRRMRELEIRIDRDLSRRHTNGHGAAD